MRILIWLLTSGLLAAAIGVVFLIMSSRRSLDSEFRHTRASAALPFLSSETVALNSQFSTGEIVTDRTTTSIGTVYTDEAIP